MVGSVAGTGKGGGRQDLQFLCYIGEAPEQCRLLASVTGLQVA